MALSKPLFNLLGSYFEQLYTHPIRTKSLSSCAIAVLGNLTSQILSGNKVINQDSVIAFGLYGLIFGGTMPHFFYLGLDAILPRGSSHLHLKQLAIERLLYAPLYQALSIYMLARLEGQTHVNAMRQLFQMFWPVLIANWRWLTLVQYVNLRAVPPMLRVLVMNIVGFIWCIYLANKRRHSKDQRGNKQ